MSIFKLLLILPAVLLMSCNETILNEKESAIPEIRIFERINVSYDSEGWPVELGEMKEVQKFQESKNHSLNKYDYIEKIEISGNFIDAKIRFINVETGSIVKELNNINSNQTIEFIGPNPDPELDLEYEEWLLNAKWHSLKIELINDQKLVFEGLISNSNN